MCISLYTAAERRLLVLNSLNPDPCYSDNFRITCSDETCSGCIHYCYFVYVLVSGSMSVVCYYVVSSYGVSDAPGAGFLTFYPTHQVFLPGFTAGCPFSHAIQPYLMYQHYGDRSDVPG